MYRIHVAAQKAGVSTQLLRAWERRYGLVSPKRTDSSYRLYTDDDVEILRGAKVLVDEGRSISEVARMPRTQLRNAAGRRRVAPVAIGAVGTDSFLDAAIAAMAAFDSGRLDSLLLQGTGMGTLSSVETCDRVLLPLLAEIGKRWEDGKLDIAAEHFGSSIVRRHLHILVQLESRRSSEGNAIVCACPEGDLHEGGLLGFALHAAVQGWSIVYLGANTPIGEILAAADRARVSGIALSMTAASKRTARREIFTRLASWKAQQPGRTVWIGGRDASLHAGEIRSFGLALMERARSPDPGV